MKEHCVFKNFNKVNINYPHKENYHIPQKVFLSQKDIHLINMFHKKGLSNYIHLITPQFKKTNVILPKLNLSYSKRLNYSEELTRSESYSYHPIKLTKVKIVQEGNDSLGKGFKSKLTKSKANKVLFHLVPVYSLYSQKMKDKRYCVFNQEKKSYSFSLQKKKDVRLFQDQGNQTALNNVYYS